MEDPDAARPESRREAPYDLVRPYVGGPGDEDGEGRPGDGYPDACGAVGAAGWDLIGL